MPFATWFEEYKKTMNHIMNSDIHIDQQNALQYYENKQNATWSALIYIQENIKSFSFDEWTRYIDYVIKIIIGKDSSEIEDLPYYELWKELDNPLLIALYAIFHSSEILDNTLLPNDATNMWNNSSYRYEIKTKIDYIMQHY